MEASERNSNPVHRLLFLRFIEKKGMLSFDIARHSEAFTTQEDWDRPSMLRDYALVLQRPRYEGKQKDDAYGEVPFLNGGV